MNQTADLTARTPGPDSRATPRPADECAPSPVPDRGPRGGPCSSGRPLRSDECR